MLSIFNCFNNCIFTLSHRKKEIIYIYKLPKLELIKKYNITFNYYLLITNIYVFFNCLCTYCKRKKYNSY